MGNISFFNKTNNGTRPISVSKTIDIISQLKKDNYASIDGILYYYIHLKISKDNISIFLTEEKSCAHIN